MKRTRFLALALVVAVMLMGAGYAAWTDQLTITNTVNTGHLDLHFVNIADELEVIPAQYTYGSVSYGADAEQGEGPDNTDKATVTLNDMYPGAVTTVNLEILNRSTMPVKLMGYEFDGDWDYLEIGATVFSYTDDDGVLQSADLADLLDPNRADIIVEEGSTISVQYTIEALDNVSEDATYTLTGWPEFMQFNQ